MKLLCASRSRKPHNFRLNCGTIPGVRERQTDSFGYSYNQRCWSCLRSMRPDTRFTTVERHAQHSFLIRQESSTTKRRRTHLLNKGQESESVIASSLKEMNGFQKWPEGNPYAGSGRYGLTTCPCFQTTVAF